ncbi:MAG: TolC family protein [Planctomycetota bacterium]
MGTTLEKGLMFCQLRPVTLLYWGLCTAVIFGMAGACSPEYYKAEADEEVYSIIDSKWHPSFGQKANYIVSDSNIPPSPNDIQIEKAVPPSRVLSLAEAVAIATAQSRQYQRAKETLYTSALELTDIRNDYEQQWFATIDGAYLDNSVDDDEFLLTSGLLSDSETDFKITQNYILANGIEIGTSLAIEWARFLTGDPRTTLGSVLSASIAIPLLGVGTGKQKWENLVQSERDVLYAIRTFNRFRKIFVVGTVNAYYGVLQQRDAVTNAENNYQRVLESKERLEMEAKAGRRTRIDVDEAQQNVLQAQDRVVRAQQSYKQSLDNFKIRLALPTDADIELDQNELKALEEIGISQPDYTLDTAVETALLQRLDLANTADEIDDVVRKVVLAAEGLGPQINITGNIDYTSPDETETDFQNLRFHEGIYDFGFDIDLPLERKIERNNYRLALIALEDAQRTYDESVDNVKLDVRQAYRDLQETADRYNIQKNSLELAYRRVESNKLLLDAGRVSVRILLESEDDLLEAQIAVTAALVEHLNANLSFFRDVGILQVRPDGMWIQ